MAQAAVHIGRGAACSDAHQGVCSVEAAADEIIAACVEQILQAF